MPLRLAFSAIFLANIAPKIKPSPQLNKAIIMVKKAQKKIALKLVEHNEVNRSSKFEIGLDKAKTCPRISINII